MCMMKTPKLPEVKMPAPIPRPPTPRDQMVDDASKRARRRAGAASVTDVTRGGLMSTATTAGGTALGG